MTDATKASDGIANWAVLDAYKRITSCPELNLPIERIRDAYDAQGTAEARAVYALARMIEKHEKPPMTAEDAVRLAVCAAFPDAAVTNWSGWEGTFTYAPRIIAELDRLGFQVLPKEDKP